MLTLKELKKVVKVAGMTKRVPSEKALEKEEIVVKEILSGECDMVLCQDLVQVKMRFSSS